MPNRFTLHINITGLCLFAYDLNANPPTLYAIMLKSDGYDVPPHQTYFGYFNGNSYIADPIPNQHALIQGDPGKELFPPKEVLDLTDTFKATASRDLVGSKPHPRVNAYFQIGTCNSHDPACFCHGNHFLVASGNTRELAYAVQWETTISDTSWTFRTTNMNAGGPGYSRQLFPTNGSLQVWIWHGPPPGTPSQRIAIGEEIKHFKVSYDLVGIGATPLPTLAAKDAPTCVKCAPRAQTRNDALTCMPVAAAFKT